MDRGGLADARQTSTRRCWAAAALSAVVALHWASPQAAAAQASPPLRVIVAQDTCGDARLVEARLRTHKPAQTFVGTDQPAPLTLHLGFEVRGKTVVGRLRLELGSHPAEDAREIVGGSCAEVVDALVLVGLVLIEDATASRAEPTIDATITPVEAEPVAAPGAQEPAAPPPPGAVLRVRLFGAASGALILGQLPRGAGRAQLGPGIELVQGASGVLASARLLAAFTYADDVTVGTLPTRFWSLAGRLEVAGPRPRWSWFGVEAAGTFEFGRLQAALQQAGADQAGHAQWLSLGGLVRASASLPVPIRLELELGFFGRLRAAEFRFERADGALAGVWRIQPWGFQTAIGLALPIL